VIFSRIFGLDGTFFGSSASCADSASLRLHSVRSPLDNIAASEPPVPVRLRLLLAFCGGTKRRLASNQCEARFASFFYLNVLSNGRWDAQFRGGCCQDSRYLARSLQVITAQLADVWATITEIHLGTSGIAAILGRPADGLGLQVEPEHVNCFPHCALRG
jgi:hypothetical protein